MAALLPPSTSQGQGQLYPPGLSSFEMMPTEVLTVIVGELSQSELQSNLDLQNTDRVNAGRTIDANMRSLCLTSKRVDSIARPLLFRTITVSSPAKLMSLYAKLYENALLGLHIRQLSFEILPNRVEPNDFFPLPSGAADLLPTIEHKPPRRLTREECAAWYCDHILSSAYIEVLFRAPNIQRLVLRIQEICFRYDGDPEKYLLFSYWPFFRDFQIACGDTEFLPRLKALQLPGDPEQPGNVIVYNLCAPLFRNRSNLETIKLSQVAGFFDDPEHEISGRRASGSAFKTVKVLELRNCLCLDREFLRFGDLFHNLESLHLTLVMDHKCSRGHEGPLGQHLFEDLEGALKKMNSLRTLSLELSYHSHAIDMTKMPAEGLSLASLPRLEILRIPLLVLMRGDSTIKEGIEIFLPRVLPRSLRHLTVIIEVHCRTNWYGVGSTRLPGPTSTPISTVLALLEALSSLAEEAFPHLQEVICCYSMKGCRRRKELEIADTASTDMGEAELFGLDDDSSQHLEQIQRSVQLQSIRLGVAYEEVYSHINTRNGGWA